MDALRTDLFNNHTVLVTGGTSGIGLATAEEFSRLGARVIAAGLGANHTRSSTHVEFVELDVLDNDAMAELMNSLDRLDVVVPAAGISLGEEEVEWGAFNRVVDIQLKAVYQTLRLAYPLLRASQGSAITIASMYAYFGGGKRVAYSAAKGGVVQVTKSLAEVWGPEGVRINSVAPGWIQTPLMDALDDQETLERLVSRTPLERFGDAKEVARVIAFLASGNASFITGAVLPVDGGYLTTGI